MSKKDLARWGAALTMVVLAASASGCVGSTDSDADEADEVPAAPPAKPADGDFTWPNGGMPVSDDWEEPAGRASICIWTGSSVMCF